jgi:hypothetical protein
MYLLTDIWDEPVYTGDTVIASRPAGNGSSKVDYCRVTKINEKSVSLQVIDREGNPVQPVRWETGKFTLQKGYKGDKCVKIVRHTE